MDLLAVRQNSSGNVQFWWQQSSQEVTLINLEDNHCTSWQDSISICQSCPRKAYVIYIFHSSCGTHIQKKVLVSAPHKAIRRSLTLSWHAIVRNRNQCLSKSAAVLAHELKFLGAHSQNMCHLFCQSVIAIASISTKPFNGIVFTAIAERAGGGSGKNGPVPYQTNKC